MVAEQGAELQGVVRQTVNRDGQSQLDGQQLDVEGAVRGGRVHERDHNELDLDLEADAY